MKSTIIHGRRDLVAIPKGQRIEGVKVKFPLPIPPAGPPRQIWTGRQWTRLPHLIAVVRSLRRRIVASYEREIRFKIKGGD